MNHITHALTFSENLKNTLTGWGLGDPLSTLIVDFFSLFIVFAVSIILYYILKLIIRRILKRVVLKSKSRWDDYLYEEKVFTRMAMLIPPLVINAFVGTLIATYPRAIAAIQTGLEIYFTAIIMLVTVSFLKVVYRIYGEKESAAAKPIKGYLQIGKIIVLLVGGITMVSILAGKSPLTILAGLGAVSAVLLLVFRDSILGFVAGVQISSNNMLQIGDWITMPGHSIDGVVTDISLVIVKVRNFDNSIATIPSYTLITESFQNWRSLSEHGGRRLKRFFLVDADSVRFIDDPLKESLASLKIPGEIFRVEHEPLTNLGLFRRFLMLHLKTHQGINQELTIVVRQLQSTETGIPVEVYAFSRYTDYSSFEAFQSELFEYIFAVLHQFGLRIYQRPSFASPAGPG
jgi:miniconductance mechanosensitive channel